MSLDIENKKELYRQLGRQLEIEREKLNRRYSGGENVLELCQDDAYEKCNTLAGKLKELEEDIFTK